MSTSKMVTLHFSFSPVQSFVAEARRTRDLWAGSYILSWLSGQAMKAVVDNGGKILLPTVENDHLFHQISSPKPISIKDPASYLGSLPNRFIASVPAGIDGSICTKAINNSWKKITNEVFNIIKKCCNAKQEKLWKRQTEDFWECSWVVGDATNLLDKRKNIRIHFSPPEPGEKCTVCGQRQELACLDRPTRTLSKKWWDKLKEKTDIAKIHGLDLKENERLCAICLTKRLFPHIAKESLGWPVPEFYPSTAYISAIDWIIQVMELSKIDEAVKEKASNLLNMVQKPIVKYAERRTWHHITKISKLANEVPELAAFLEVDGAVFFKDAIYQKDSNLPNKQEIAKALKALQEEIKRHEPFQGEASPFYAMLLMDGDNMGALLSTYNNSERGQISKALSEFTSQVPEIVHDLNGILIYAGGDDVFALLPVSTAIECARRCKIAYECSFKKIAPFVPSQNATISAAIQFAHMNTALGVVVRDSHKLLDNIAKDETGRDSIACKVWKRGGPILTWAKPWEKMENLNGLIIHQVCEAFTDDSNQPDKFSSKFFYKLRELFSLLDSNSILSKEEIVDLLIAEYLANREHKWPKALSKKDILEKSKQRVELLLELCTRYKRTTEDSGDVKINPEGGYDPAGALLVRFLVQKEV